MNIMKNSFGWIILSVLAAIGFSIADIFISYIIEQRQGEKPVIPIFAFLFVYGLVQLVIITIIWMLSKNSHDLSGLLVTKKNGFRINNFICIFITGIISTASFIAMIYAYRFVNEGGEKNIGTVKTIMAIQPFLVLLFLCLVTWKKENKLILGKAPKPTCRDFAGAAIVIFGIAVANT